MRGMRTFGLVAALALAPAAADAADAAEFNATSVSVLYGTGFDDIATGMASPTERLFTLTLENSLAWAYGDSFFFMDMASGRFAEGQGTDYTLYAEWAPRLSLSKITGAEIVAGPLRDLLIAGEINRGPGFNVLLGGLGTSLDVPGFAFWSLNAYVRKDNFNGANYQVTTSWGVPFDIGAVGLSFEGFADVYGTDAAGFNLLTQPQLLVDVGEHFGARENRLRFGTEVWIHHTTVLAGQRYTTFAPQVMAKFAF